MGIIMIFLLIVAIILAIIFIGFWKLFVLALIVLGGYFLVKFLIKKFFMN